MNIRMKLTLLVFVISTQLLMSQNNTIKISDTLLELPKGNITISGYLGVKFDSCIKNGVMLKEFPLYVKTFKEHNDDPGKWQGEFWGKWFTSATLAYHYQPTIQNKKIVDAAVDMILSTQDKNTGRISSYKKDFGDWDIWGRKYVLLGLVAHFDQTGNKKSLQAATKMLDEIINISGPGKQKLTESGLAFLTGLAPSSILEPVVLVYQRTGQAKYLDFAKYIVSLWSEPNKFTDKGMRLVEDALAGVDPIHISAPKGYEQMSCFEGLIELYRVTGYKKYLDAATTFSKNVIAKEIMIVGSGSSGELWCDGVNRQTEMLEQPMETCVTTTWIKLCYQLLRLTGDPIWADQMEVSLYNSLLGAMVNNGEWWAYFSSLVGERMPSPLQVPSCNSSCCVANGPRGLLTAPGWSVMVSKDGPVVNLYASGTYKYPLTDKNEIILTQATAYPKTGSVEITVNQNKSLNYTLSLRIPEWSKNTKVEVNGNAVECNNTGYLKINREWKNGDKIILTLDMRGRIMHAQNNVNQMAIMRGPIVLALDNRLVKEDSQNLWLLHDGYKWIYDKAFKIDYALLEPVSDINKVKYIDIKPVESLPVNIWMGFEVPFLIRPTHFIGHKKTKLIMCDYASAGNQYSPTNLFRVWLPQPMFMNTIFPKETWKLLQNKKERPKVPELKPFILSDKQ